MCDDSWDSFDARVACRQLGLPSSGAIAFTNAHFGQGSGRINLDDVSCSGNETSLFSCSYTTNHNCGHSEDAGVLCASNSTISITPSPTSTPGNQFTIYFESY